MNWLGKYNFFRNYGGGKKEDSENAERERKAVANFERYIAGTPLEREMVVSATPAEETFERVFFPAMGLVTGLLTSRMFVSPHSFYIGKIWTATLVWAGYNLGKRRYEVHRSHYYTHNFTRFPAEIQLMLRTGDCRYARDWWVDSRFEQRMQERDKPAE